MHQIPNNLFETRFSSFGTNLHHSNEYVQRCEQNRSQKEINDDMTVEKAREAETLWFQNHAVFRDTVQSNPELFGVESLTRKLSDILVSRIAESLPEMITEVKLKIRETQASIKKLGHSIPEDDAGKL